MSIKRKKHISQSNNDYRWERIEEFLILKGYILRDDDKDYRVWVDCVSNGRDIRYSLSGLLSTHALGPGDPSTHWISPVFEVMSSNHQVHGFTTLRGAIHASRYNARY